MILIATPTHADTVPFVYIDDRTSGKNEAECRRIVETIFEKPFKKCRPSFLRNPETGRCLELDMYNEELQLAIEYNGQQHYAYTPKFHRHENDLQKQVARDELKKVLCHRNGVRLIVVLYTVPFQQLEAHLRRALKG
jgi:hypothetical protein